MDHVYHEYCSIDEIDERRNLVAIEETETGVSSDEQSHVLNKVSKYYCIVRFLF